MNTADATIGFKGLNVVSGASGSFTSLGGVKSASIAAVTAMTASDEGNVILDITPPVPLDQADLISSYAYAQLTAPHSLVFKVEFDDGFPSGAEFAVTSTAFPGFNVNRAAVANVELNATTTSPFETDLTFSLWLKGEPLAAISTVSLKFYKIVTDPGGIDKQEKIAESTLAVNNRL